MLMGGYDRKKGERLNEIWIYDLNKPNLKWIKSEHTLPEKMNSFSYVLTDDDEYLIILFGYGREWKNDIYILDLLSMEFTTSKVKGPETEDLLYAGAPKAFLTVDNLKTDTLIVGYIKKMDFKNMFTPQEIVEIILSYHSTQYIHILQRDQNRVMQFKIAVSALFV